jgi:hypothetical protein
MISEMGKINAEVRAMRYFNIAGPCSKAKHYMIEASSRLRGVERLIEMNKCFFAGGWTIRS